MAQVCGAEWGKESGNRFTAQGGFGLWTERPPGLQQAETMERPVTPGRENSISKGMDEETGMF